MKVICGIFLAIMGAIMLFKPKIIWKIGDSWKIKTDAQPTEVYIMLIRVAGLILIIGGIFAAFSGL